MYVFGTHILLPPVGASASSGRYSMSMTKKSNYVFDDPKNTLAFL